MKTDANPPIIDLAEDGPITIMVYGCQHHDELYLAEHGKDFYGVLWDLLEGYLRRKVNKGEHDFKTADEALEAVWDQARELMESRGVSLDAVS